MSSCNDPNVPQPSQGSPAAAGVWPSSTSSTGTSACRAANRPPEGSSPGRAESELSSEASAASGGEPSPPKASLPAPVLPFSAASTPGLQHQPTESGHPFPTSATPSSTPSVRGRNAKLLLITAALLSVIFQIVALVTNVFSGKYSVKVGFFGGQVCASGTGCTDSSLNELTCGKEANMIAAGALTALCLIGDFVLIVLLAVELYHNRLARVSYKSLWFCGVVGAVRTVPVILVTRVRTEAYCNQITLTTIRPYTFTYGAAFAFLLSSLALMCLSFLVAFFVYLTQLDRQDVVGEEERAAPHRRQPVESPDDNSTGGAERVVGQQRRDRIIAFAVRDLRFRTVFVFLYLVLAYLLLVAVFFESFRTNNAPGTVKIGYFSDPQICYRGSCSNPSVEELTCEHSLVAPGVMNIISMLAAAIACALTVRLPFQPPSQRHKYLFLSTGNTEGGSGLSTATAPESRESSDSSSSFMRYFLGEYWTILCPGSVTVFLVATLVPVANIRATALCDYTLVRGTATAVFNPKFYDFGPSFWLVLVSLILSGSLTVGAWIAYVTKDVNGDEVNLDPQSEDQRRAHRRHRVFGILLMFAVVLLLCCALGLEVFVTGISDVTFFWGRFCPAGASSACTAGYTVDDLTCGNGRALTAAAAFAILGLLAALLTAAVMGAELHLGRPLLQHSFIRSGSLATMLGTGLLILVSVALIITIPTDGCRLVSNTLAVSTSANATSLELASSSNRMPGYSLGGAASCTIVAMCLIWLALLFPPEIANNSQKGKYRRYAISVGLCLATALTMALVSSVGRHQLTATQAIVLPVVSEDPSLAVEGGCAEDIQLRAGAGFSCVLLLAIVVSCCVHAINTYRGSPWIRGLTETCFLFNGLCAVLAMGLITGYRARRHTCTLPSSTPMAVLESTSSLAVTKFDIKGLETLPLSIVTMLCVWFVNFCGFLMHLFSSSTTSGTDSPDTARQEQEGAPTDEEPADVCRRRRHPVLLLFVFGAELLSLCLLLSALSEDAVSTTGSSTQIAKVPFLGPKKLCFSDASNDYICTEASLDSLICGYGHAFNAAAALAVLAVLGMAAGLALTLLEVYRFRYVPSTVVSFLCNVFSVSCLIGTIAILEHLVAKKMRCDPTRPGELKSSLGRNLMIASFSVTALKLIIHYFTFVFTADTPADRAAPSEGPVVLGVPVPQQQEGGHASVEESRAEGQQVPPQLSQEPHSEQPQRAPTPALPLDVAVPEEHPADERQLSGRGKAGNIMVLGVLYLCLVFACLSLGLDVVHSRRRSPSGPVFSVYVGLFGGDLCYDSETNWRAKWQCAARSLSQVTCGDNRKIVAGGVFLFLALAAIVTGLALLSIELWKGTHVFPGSRFVVTAAVTALLSIAMVCFAQQEVGQPLCFEIDPEGKMPWTVDYGNEDFETSTAGGLLFTSIALLLLSSVASLIVSLYKATVSQTVLCDNDNDDRVPPPVSAAEEGEELEERRNVPVSSSEGRGAPSAVAANSTTHRSNRTPQKSGAIVTMVFFLLVALLLIGTLTTDTYRLTWNFVTWRFQSVRNIQKGSVGFFGGTICALGATNGTILVPNGTCIHPSVNSMTCDQGAPMVAAGVFCILALVASVVVVGCKCTELRQWHSEEGAGADSLEPRPVQRDTLTCSVSELSIAGLTRTAKVTIYGAFSVSVFITVSLGIIAEVSETVLRCQLRNIATGSDANYGTAFGLLLVIFLSVWPMTLFLVAQPLISLRPSPEATSETATMVSLHKVKVVFMMVQFAAAAFLCGALGSDLYVNSNNEYIESRVSFFAAMQYQKMTKVDYPVSPGDVMCNEGPTISAAAAFCILSLVCVLGTLAAVGLPKNPFSSASSRSITGLGCVLAFLSEFLTVMMILRVKLAADCYYSRPESPRMWSTKIKPGKFDLGASFILIFCVFAVHSILLVSAAIFAFLKHLTSQGGDDERRQRSTRSGRVVVAVVFGLVSFFLVLAVAFESYKADYGSRNFPRNSVRVAPLKAKVCNEGRCADHLSVLEEICPFGYRSFYAAAALLLLALVIALGTVGVATLEAYRKEKWTPFVRCNPKWRFSVVPFGIFATYVSLQFAVGLLMYGREKCTKTKSFDLLWWGSTIPITLGKWNYGVGFGFAMAGLVLAFLALCWQQYRHHVWARQVDWELEEDKEQRRTQQRDEGEGEGEEAHQPQRELDSTDNRRANEAEEGEEEPKDLSLRDYRGRVNLLFFLFLCALLSIGSLSTAIYTTSPTGYYSWAAVHYFGATVCGNTVCKSLSVDALTCKEHRAIYAAAAISFLALLGIVFSMTVMGIELFRGRPVFPLSSFLCPGAVVVLQLVVVIVLARSAREFNCGTVNVSLGEQSLDFNPKTLSTLGPSLWLTVTSIVLCAVSTLIHLYGYLHGWSRAAPEPPQQAAGDHDHTQSQGEEGEAELCPEDDHCSLVNDPSHQRRFAHTCRIYPCPHGGVPYHALLFRHYRGQMIGCDPPSFWACLCTALNHDQAVECLRCGAKATQPQQWICVRPSCSALNQWPLSSSESRTTPMCSHCHEEPFAGPSPWCCPHCRTIQHRFSLRCAGCEKERPLGWRCLVCQQTNSIFQLSCGRCREPLQDFYPGRRPREEGSDERTEEEPAEHRPEPAPSPLLGSHQGGEREPPIASANLPAVPPTGTPILTLTRDRHPGKVFYGFKDEKGKVHIFAQALSSPVSSADGDGDGA